MTGALVVRYHQKRAGVETLVGKKHQHEGAVEIVSCRAAERNLLESTMSVSTHHQDICIDVIACKLPIPGSQYAANRIDKMISVNGSGI